MPSHKLPSVTVTALPEAYQKVLYFFFSFPESEIGLNDLASSTKMSKTTARDIVLTLEKEGFLIKKVYGKSWRITCSKEHPYNFTRKIAFNLYLVLEAYQKGVRDEILNVVGNTNAVLLFGSYRKGDDTEKSDVDIAVEVSGTESLKVIELGIIPAFGFRENVRVNLHVFSRNRIDLNLFANIAQGIVLEGFLEVGS